MQTSTVNPAAAPRGRDLPSVIRAPAGAVARDLAAMLARDAAQIRARLLASGAVLFRGYSIRSAEDLAALQAQMGASMRYIGGDSPRTKLTKNADVYTSTEALKSVRLPLHNELSYLDVQPRLLWFACLKPARRGGATVLADGRAILAAMNPEVRERFERLGVRYRLGFRGPGRSLEALDRLARANKSWMDAFETDDRNVVEGRCREMNARFEWTGAGHLVLETERPATTRHPVTGRRVWFNQAHLFHLNARYLGRVRFALARAFFAATGLVPHDASFGDGSPISDDVIAHLFDVLDAHTVPVVWEAGDALLVDNVLAMHGREPFRGDRKIVVAMSS
jgi:alpha-ketoglutarate-dependent taurine dioxygenase